MRNQVKVSFLAGTLGRGGAEKQLIYMLRAVQTAGIEPRVLCLTRGESYEQEIRSLGIPVEWVGRRQDRLLRLADIIRYLRKNPPDILQSSHFFTNIYAGLAGRFLRIPSIGAIRSDLLSEIRIHGRYGRWQLSLPRFLIANSAVACENAIGRGVSPQKISFVPNIVETGQNGNGKIKKNADEITMLFVGRLDALKRPDRFVRLARVLTAKHPSLALRFRVAGDGELRAALEKEAESLPAGKIEFLGVCRQMNEIYRQADILISTSAREGTSNVILEAMAHGLPVVATEVGGTPEILDSRRGILVGLDDEAALAEAAERLVLDRDLRLRLGAAGRQYVEKKHSLDYLENQLTGIYENLLQG